jgi:hypothetical protein
MGSVMASTLSACGIRESTSHTAHTDSARKDDALFGLAVGSCGSTSRVRTTEEAATGNHEDTHTMFRDFFAADKTIVLSNQQHMGLMSSAEYTDHAGSGVKLDASPRSAPDSSGPGLSNGGHGRRPDSPHPHSVGMSMSVSRSAWTPRRGLGLQGHRRAGAPCRMRMGEGQTPRIKVRSKLTIGP